MPDLDPIVVQLRDERLRRCLSMRDLCPTPRTEFIRQSLSGWERGRVNPTLSSLRSWARVLGYDLVLVPRQEEAAP